MKIQIDDNGGFVSLVKKYKQLTDNIGQVSDDAVAKVAAKGRRRITDYEEQTFRMGNKNYKGSKDFYSQSRYDPKLGGYVSAGGKQAQTHKMMAFSFETVASRRYRMVAKYSHVKLSSKLANLWENDTKSYTAHSPFFWREGGKVGWVNKGEVRKAKPFFLTEGVQGVQQVIPQALAEADQKLTDRLKTMGFI